jgi:hypothetical protein
MTQSTAGAGAGGGGLFGNFFGGGGGGKKASAGVEMSSRAVTEVQKPKMIEGWLMKKSSAGGGQLIGAEWQKR